MPDSEIGVYADPADTQALDQQITTDRAKNQLSTGILDGYVKANQAALNDRLTAARQQFDDGIEQTQALNTTMDSARDNFMSQFEQQMKAAASPKLNLPMPEAEQPTASSTLGVPAQQTIPTAQSGRPTMPTERGMQEPGTMDLTPNQYTDKTLTAAEADSACGPAAAVAFARAYGRNPTLREAVDLAKEVGWNTTTGTAGIAGQKALLDKMGVPARTAGAPDWNLIATDASSGNPVAVSTAQHYFVIDGYDPNSGKYHMGTSGKIMANLGGSEWMTPEEINRVGRGINGVLYMDHPASPTPSAGVQSSPAPPKPESSVAGVTVGGQETNPQPTQDMVTPQLGPSYNEQTPTGDWQQVTPNLSTGTNQTAPIAAPTPEAQANYQAQNDLTQGFTNPSIGQNEAGMSIPLLAQPQNNLAPQIPTQSAAPEPPQGKVSGMLDQPAQPQTIDPMSGATSNDMAGLFRKFADFLEGAQNAGKQNPNDMPTKEVTGLIPENFDQTLPALQRMGQATADALTRAPDAADTALSAVNPGIPAARRVMDAGAAFAKENANNYARGISGQTDYHDTGFSNVPLLGGALEAAGNPTNMIPMGAGAKANAALTAGADAVAAGAAKGTMGEAFNNVARQAVEEASLPPMGGGATSARPTLDGLTKLLGGFGEAIDKSKTLPEAFGKTMSMDNAVDSLSQGLREEFGKIPLKPEERLAVADFLEGVAPKTPLSQEVLDAADQMKGVVQQVGQMAQKAGILKEATELYFPHMVATPDRKPISPSVLSDFATSTMGRKRDAEGNVLLPTLRDFADYIAAKHPDWKVIDDPATLVAAQVKGMATAANHAALIDYVKGSVNEVGPAFSDGVVKQIAEDGTKKLMNAKALGYKLMDLPSSMSKWLYAGTAPEEGAIALGKRGVKGAAENEGQTVLQEKALNWVRPDVARLLEQYTKTDLMPQAISQSGVGKAYTGLTRTILQNKLINSFIHGENMVSELIEQYADPRALAGVKGDFAFSENIMRDPVARTELLQRAPLSLPTVKNWAHDLANIKSLPGEAGPISRAYDATGGKVFDKLHEMLFEGLGQRLQLMSFAAAKRMGMNDVEAANYANVKLGQYNKPDLNALTSTINKYALFAGPWTTSTAIKLGSLANKTGYGGFGAYMKPEELATVGNALRSDLLKGVVFRKLTDQMVYHAVTGKWPKEDEGSGTRVTNPMFKREDDMLNLIVEPFNKAFIEGGGAPELLKQPVKVVANKLNPAFRTIASAVANEQYPGGPPIVRNADKGDAFATMKDYAAFAGKSILPTAIADRLPPTQDNRRDLGIPGALLNVNATDQQPKGSSNPRPPTPARPAVPRR